jgi:hypothetical protein
MTVYEMVQNDFIGLVLYSAALAKGTRTGRKTN